MSSPTQPAPSPSLVLRLADLPKRKPTRFHLRPAEESNRTLAQELKLTDLRKLTLVGEITPTGKADWRLSARLGATVVQPCVVTLEPVTTRIEEPVERVFLASWEPPVGAEVEMPEDTSSEPLPATLDLNAIMAEELALALPQYPRTENAGVGDTQVTEPGKKAMTDDDAKPFAALAKLKLVDGPKDT
ncbi:YceD family protein [Tropicimonas sp. S265A]|uniref:YceD family protein n=1 Tax=Tropicimonas sp. S265A TaxID=3415134 RepID=UPI003C7ED614